MNGFLKGAIALKDTQARRVIAFAVALVFVMLAGTATASAVTYVDVYTGIWDQTWTYTQSSHYSVIGNYTAHDVSTSNAGQGPLVHFSPAPATATAYVSSVTVPCGTAADTGYFVRLSVWENGLYFGEVGYQHLTNIQVSAGNWYSAAQALGTILTTGTSNPCWTAPHVHYEGQGNNPTYPSYWQHQFNDNGNVATGIWYPYSDFLLRLYN